MCSLQVIFEHEGVFIHPASDEDGIEQDLLISGSLRIVDKVNLFPPGHLDMCGLSFQMVMNLLS